MVAIFSILVIFWIQGRAVRESTFYFDPSLWLLFSVDIWRSYSNQIVMIITKVYGYGWLSCEIVMHTNALDL